MAAYQAGEFSAFEKLYDRLAGKLRGYLSSLTWSREQAEDLLQETFLQIHRSRHMTFRGYGNQVDDSAAIRLTPGTFSANPGKVSHYEWTTIRAEIQVQATGPWETVYVRRRRRAAQRHELRLAAGL